MSVFLWFTLTTTPAIMIFNDLNDTLKNYLFLNEILWFLDIVRKLLFQNVKGQDTYTSAVKYIRSTLILDALACLPQLLWFMDPNYAFLKNIRLYQIWLLYHPMKWAINNIPSIKGEH